MPGIFEVPGQGSTSTILLRPSDAWALLLLGHGAGAGMRHPFMAGLAGCLAPLGLATLRYQFLYMERGRRRPDRAPLLLDTVRAAVAAAGECCPDLPLLAGGKSMGGRMTSMAAAERPLAGVRGLVLIGFPLHPAGKPGLSRGHHLDNTSVPLLFLQGTRDRLADRDLMAETTTRLGSRAHLEWLEGADHGFHVLKRSGRSDPEVLSQLGEALADWGRGLVSSKL